MTMKLLIKNLSAVLCDAAESIPGPVDIAIEDHDILEIGHNLAINDGSVIDGSGCVAIPGLVNTHHHFYQTLTRAIPLMQNSGLFQWLVDHYKVWQELTRDAVYWSTLTACAELMLTGCTLTTDHHYLFPEGESDLIGTQVQAAREIGIRFLATRGSMSVSEEDGGLPPRSVVQKEDVILEDSLRCIQSFHDPSETAMTRIALAPCSPFSVSENLMRSSADLARQYRVKLHTHLAETLDEEKYCIRTFGCRPVDLMKRFDWLGSDVWFAHCVHLNESEIQLFADTGTSVAHCPSSNMRLGSGIAPIVELRSRGAPVGLAVDGSASNDSSNMLGELRQALFLQRVLKGARAMRVMDAFDMGTVGGARLLGFNRIGCLRPGWIADLAMFRVDRIDFTGVHDPIAGLILAGTSSRADTVIVNGRITVSNGRLVTGNEWEIRDQASRIARLMVEKATQRTGKQYNKPKS